MEADDYSFGMDLETAELLGEVLATSWGTEDFVKLLFLSYADGAEFVASMA